MRKILRRFLIQRRLLKSSRALQASHDLSKRFGGAVLDYNQKMEQERTRLRNKVEALCHQAVSDSGHAEATLYLTLIYFSSIGAHMVEKADRWLKSWGGGLIESGFREIGLSYIQHAEEEVGHDNWHRRDVKVLAEMFQEKFGHNLEVSQLLLRGRVDCVKRYEELCEEEVSGPLSYRSLGVLYETEIMALDLAPKFIGFCVGELGFEVLKGLGFLNGHMESDIDHIRDNVIQMHEFLKRRPDSLNELVDAGQKTVSIFEEYFEACLEMAQNHISELNRSTRGLESPESRAAASG